MNYMELNSNKSIASKSNKYNNLFNNKTYSNQEYIADIEDRSISKILLNSPSNISLLSEKQEINNNIIFKQELVEKQKTKYSNFLRNSNSKLRNATEPKQHNIELFMTTVNNNQTTYQKTKTQNDITKESKVKQINKSNRKSSLNSHKQKITKLLKNAKINQIRNKQDKSSINDENRNIAFLNYRSLESQIRKEKEVTNQVFQSNEERLFTKIAFIPEIIIDNGPSTLDPDFFIKYQEKAIEKRNHLRMVPYSKTTNLINNKQLFDYNGRINESTIESFNKINFTSSNLTHKDIKDHIYHLNIKDTELKNKIIRKYNKEEMIRRNPFKIKAQTLNTNLLLNNIENAHVLSNMLTEENIISPKPPIVLHAAKRNKPFTNTNLKSLLNVENFNLTKKSNRDFQVAKLENIVIKSNLITEIKNKEVLSNSHPDEEFKIDIDKYFNITQGKQQAVKLKRQRFKSQDQLYLLKTENNKLYKTLKYALPSLFNK